MFTLCRYALCLVDAFVITCIGDDFTSMIKVESVIVFFNYVGSEIAQKAGDQWSAR